jgi:hypothetical protein
MSFDWANALLFRLTGSAPAASRRDGGDGHRPDRQSETAHEPNYNHMFSVAKNLNPDWRTITLNVVRDASAPSTC